MAVPYKPDPAPHEEPDLTELAARAARDPAARAFVEEVWASVADGSIHDQLANQADLQALIQEQSH